MTRAKLTDQKQEVCQEIKQPKGATLGYNQTEGATLGKKKYRKELR